MRSSTQRIRDLCVFSVLGALMFTSQIAMIFLPNIHLLGLFIAALTLTYRVRALIPIYLYIMLYGAFYGFSMWWMPYIYIWLPLWGIFMFAGKLKLPERFRRLLYMLLCGLHGLSFGALYAPAHALMFKMSFKAVCAWIIAGLPFDVTHAVSDLAFGTLIIPLSSLLRRLDIQKNRP